MNSRPDHVDALRAARVMEHLSRFDARVAGTPPLGIAVADSDIDVLCHAPDLAEFGEVVGAAFGHQRGFCLEHRTTASGKAVIAGFQAHGWEFEIFGQDVPVDQQAGWRHFLVEERLLRLGGGRFRAAVMEFRDGGLKTEPAFAAVLGLRGDPYQAMLEIGALEDEDLSKLIDGAAGNNGS